MTIEALEGALCTRITLAKDGVVEGYPLELFRTEGNTASMRNEGPLCCHVPPALGFGS